MMLFSRSSVAVFLGALSLFPCLILICYIVIHSRGSTPGVRSPTSGAAAGLCDNSQRHHHAARVCPTLWMTQTALSMGGGVVDAIYAHKIPVEEDLGVSSMFTEYMQLMYVCAGSQ